MRQVIHGGQHGPERLAIVHNSANGHASETSAVIGALSSDEARALAFTSGAMIGKRDFQCGIYGLRA